ncbi:MAG: AgmX/PglI C-terminal domain-containing protein [Myxococcales bacterium]|nr:AgmX/PglI C-terminal domain-containing protein [Myxococcales bacterium]
MDFESPPSHGKKNLVIVIVVLGMAVLGVSAYVAFSKRGGGGGSGGGGGGGGAVVGDKAAVAKWCTLRKEWGQKVNALSGDILLKAVSDPKEAEKLRDKRNSLCKKYAADVQDAVKKAGAPVVPVETALIKEGKVRANVFVEIGNHLTQLATEDVAAMQKDKKALETTMKVRISAGRAKADGEVQAALKATGCTGVYRGPMTDDATASNPYVSWDELEFKRTRAIKRIDQRLQDLEPKIALTNQVYHKLVASYGGVLKRCYHSAKRKKPGMSAQMDLRVRLKADGKVKSLGIERMEVRGPVLACLLKQAGRWKFSKPMKANDFVVVSIDFSRL